MKTISCWNDLSSYGIRLLTGEACGLSYRFLCDLTEKGKHVLEKCLDTRIELTEPWNSGAIGSILLPPEMLVSLGVFALLESGCKEVWRNGDQLYGIEADDAESEVARRVRDCGRRYAYQGTAGSRNRHEFTGRIH